MNKTLLECFEWYLPNDLSLWRWVAENASTFREWGLTDVWLPPAYKGAGGASDPGYGVYDLYDLGEFDQKGSVPTKYGTRDEYLAAIEALHNNGLGVIADVVFDHRMGADYAEQVSGQPFSSNDRNQPLDGDENITVWTGFDFPGRQDKYSAFHWNHTHFSSSDDSGGRQDEVFQLDHKGWNLDVDKEYGNYDYLMGVNVDTSNPDVIAELDRWGEWYLSTTNVDGFRIDAVKHIDFKFFKHWLGELRAKSGRELWAVGEYWQRDLRALTNYLDESENVMSLFDVPLHYNFQRAGEQGSDFDMRQIFDNTLAAVSPWQTATFVDNHDTQPGQPLGSWVPGWFKPLAYALILLRERGVPSVFYGDLYGIPSSGIDPVGDRLPLMIKIRADRAYGEQVDYFNDKNVVGWTRLGDEEHPNSGLAVVMSNGDGGSKEMPMGTKFAGRVFVDLLGNCPGEVVLDDGGVAAFPCNPGSVSAWGLKEG